MALTSLLLAGLLPALAPSDPNLQPAGQIVLQRDDTIGGVGDVTVIQEAGVDDAGNWYAVVDTDHGNTDEDGVFVRNGSPVLREGDAMNVPPGAVVDSFGRLDGSVTDTGTTGWILQLEGGGITGADQLALYAGGEQLFRTGEPLVAPGVPPGAFWTTFNDAKANEAGQLLLMGAVNDPVQGVVRALVLVTHLGGGAWDLDLLAYAGQAQAGAPEAVTELENGQHEYALSDAGHAIYAARLDDGPLTDRAVFLDGALVAREGSASPVPGRPWQVLFNSQVDVNSHGDHVLTGILEGVNDDDALIERSGEVLVREGDVLASISPWQVTFLGPPQVTSAIEIGDNGNVLWVGQWSDPGKFGVKGLFLNDRLLVEEGATVIDGQVIASFEPGEGGHTLSDDGETVLLRARLANNDSVLVRLDIGPWVSLGGGLAGTGGVMPCLVGAGELGEGDQFSLGVANGPANAPAWLVTGLSQLNAPFKGGVLIPDVDLLLSLPLDGGGARELAVVVPVGGFPPALDLTFQWWVQDAGGPVGFSASNAVQATTP